MNPILSLLLTWFLIHYVWDFHWQPQWCRLNKWNNWRALLGHIGLYSIPYLIFLFGAGNMAALGFMVVNVVSHLAIDGVTSKISHEQFERKDYWHGFNTVGFDQMLHYMVLAWSVFYFYG